MSARSSSVIGILPGEGIGPEVVDAALQVLSALEAEPFDVRFGGAIGLEAVADGGPALSEEVVSFCESVFADRGAVLAGAGGGRFVYDLRQRFDLFCKISPLQVHEELAGAGVLDAEHVRGVDIAIVREGVSGVYQGSRREDGGRAEHVYGSSKIEVARALARAAELARARRAGSQSS